MLFNSITYAVFLPIVFVVYWSVLKHYKTQNVFLLIASYVFYGWWDWRFLSLIFISSLVDYAIGLKLYQSQNRTHRRWLLYVSLFVNLGFLGFFKYFNFFIHNFVRFLTTLGFQPDERTLNIILPVGISFYTFQSLSYSLDVYNRKISPTNDIIAFLAFVSFFPQLVAGPIERARNLLPQFEKTRKFEYEKGADGLKQLLWGLFKKVVIADTCAENVDFIFNNYETLSGSVLWLGALYFAFQIYCDFSGYSDIAIGTAKLLGFDLMRNFALPYFSRDIPEFWRRWHISLSTWFRDYLYIPLGGSYRSKFSRIRNILITFTISGFWHGANWTFIVWGLLNGLYYIPFMLSKREKVYKNEIIMAKDWRFPSSREFGGIIVTFLMTLVAWVFFRSQNISQAFEYLNIMFSWSLFSLPLNNNTTIFWIGGFVLIEWLQRKKEHGLQGLQMPVFMRWGIYYLAIFFILRFGGNEKPFIYFQF